MNETSAYVAYRRSGFLAWIYDTITGHKFTSILISADSVIFQGKNRLIVCKFTDMRKPSQTSSLFTHCISLSDGQRYRKFRGLSSQTAERILKEIDESECRWWLSELQSKRVELEAANQWVSSLQSPSQYVRKSLFSQEVKKCRRISKKFPERIPVIVLMDDTAQLLQSIRGFLLLPVSVRQEANERFINLELKKSADYFDSIEETALSEEQRRAVVVDEDANLVVAAAGSGKTSVIVAKTGWQIRKGFRPPHEILLMAFARKAQAELVARLTSRLGKKIAEQLTVKTFHGLGVMIIGEATGLRPSLSKVAEDDIQLFALIKNILRELCSEKKYLEIIRKWFGEHFAQYKSIYEFSSMGAYWHYIKSHEIRTLKGEKVKSFEECEIANFLFMSGINYLYEPAYEHQTATDLRHQYKPDFYLPDYQIYIEHLALKGFARTPDFIDRREYLKSLRWKRTLHKKHGTELIETYSCEKHQGILTQKLEEKLISRGVVFNPISGEELFLTLEKLGQVDDFTRLVGVFLGHFKAGQISQEELHSRVGEGQDQSRNRAFISAFIPAYDRYQRYLSERNEIDFNDMISHATQLVQSGHFKSPYGYICVDEFQDISVGRAKLLQALQAARKDAQVFSVGDDWQSIFRFAGSDIGVMQDFAKYFGTAERVDLKTTYRCSAEITKVSADFICKNQLQLKKDVKAIFSTRKTGILIGVQTQDKESLLLEALRIIDEDETSDHRKTVFLLGRYKHERPEHFLKLCRDFPNLNIKFYTIHGAKGLECDYVIVLSMVSGRLGFPSVREDDPVLSMVLAKPDDFPNAEERRLFYVALTRARKRAVLLTDLSYPSTFIRELITGAYEVDYFGRTPTDEVSCPKCIEGILRIKNSEKGVFFGCVNHPYCLHTEQACPHCSKGLPRIRRENLVCTFCDQQVEPCPKKLCGGWLTLKTGRYGNFWGCTNYWSEKQCTYTRNAD